MSGCEAVNNWSEAPQPILPQELLYLWRVRAVQYVAQPSMPLILCLLSEKRKLVFVSWWDRFYYKAVIAFELYKYLLETGENWCKNQVLNNWRQYLYSLLGFWYLNIIIYYLPYTNSDINFLTNTYFGWAIKHWINNKPISVIFHDIFRFVSIFTKVQYLCRVTFFISKDYVRKTIHIFHKNCWIAVCIGFRLKFDTSIDQIQNSHFRIYSFRNSNILYNPFT